MEREVLTLVVETEEGEVKTLSLSPSQLTRDPKLRKVPFNLIRNGGEEGERIRLWFEEVMGWKIHIPKEEQ